MTSDDSGPFFHQSLNPLHLSSGHGGGMLVSFAAVEQALKDMGDPLGEAQVRSTSSSCLPSPGSISAQLVYMPVCLRMAVSKGMSQGILSASPATCDICWRILHVIAPGHSACAVVRKQGPKSKVSKHFNFS